MRIGTTGRFITSQYGGRCATCRRTISEGEKVYWRPSDNETRGARIYCADGECAVRAAEEDGVSVPPERTERRRRRA